MAATRWTFALFWVRAALGLVVIALLLLYLVVGPLFGRIIRVAETEGLASSRWARQERWFELAGGAGGLILIVVVWLMVTKPS